MQFLIPSFLAGVLTVLAPCVITLLPVTLGGTLGEKSKWRPLVIALSLGVSVMLFTLLLRASTAFIDIPNSVWRWISGGLVLLFGLTMTFPHAWEKLAVKLKLYKANNLLSRDKGAVLLGASLGPVFTTCSPTYALILAIVLPANFGVGLLNLFVYTVGLLIPVLLIGYGGRQVTVRLRGAVNPDGWFKRGLGVLLLLTGLAIVTGFDKTLETRILDSGYLGPIELEQSLIERFEDDGSADSEPLEVDL